MASQAAKAAASETTPAETPLPAGVTLEQGINVDDVRRKAYDALLSDTSHNMAGFSLGGALPPSLPPTPRRSGISYDWVKGGRRAQVADHVFNTVIAGSYRFAFYGDLVTLDDETYDVGIEQGKLLPAAV